MISIPGAPKPLVAPCGGSNSDPNILINGNAWTLSNAKCSTPSTHSNPSIAWTIDRSNSTISNYQSVDYLTSYIYKVQEAQKANGQISSISAREPAMLGVMLSASVVDENGNGIPTSSGANQTCTQPSNIYGCYYVNSTSSIQCGKSNGQIVAGFTPDTKKDTYLSGLEFILDTSNQVNCPSVGTSPAPPPVSPLKYSRGAKFVCGVGGTDVGSVLSQYATSPVAPSTTLNWNSTPQCDNNAKDIVSNDVQLRIDPAPSSSGVSAYVPSSSIQTTLGSSAAATQYYSDLGYINSILTNPNAYLSNMILPATPAGITQPQPNQATCSNSRNKVPLESGFCVAVPQPTCINAYQTNYGAVDQSNQQQTVDGYANWDIPANQAYGTPFAGTCLANTMPNSNGAPLRFCTLDSTKGNNVAVLSQIYNPCAPIPPPPPWWPSSATYTATSGNAIPDNLWATAWNDINIRFTDGTNKFANTPPTSYPSGTVNNASTIGEVPTVILASGDIIPAYLPNPYLNNCVPVTIPGYKNVQICAADNTYYYKYSGGLRGQNIVTYNSTTKCIPRGITYSDGTGNTGFPLDAYKVGINQTDTSGPCCPSGTESGTQGYCGICCGTPSYMYGAVTSVWINGQIDNTCMKNTCASGN